MPETSITPPAVSRPNKPVSEALLNEKVSFDIPFSTSPFTLENGRTDENIC
jgi:hypothetical protein